MPQTVGTTKPLTLRPTYLLSLRILLCACRLEIVHFHHAVTLALYNTAAVKALAASQ